MAATVIITGRIRRTARSCTAPRKSAMLAGRSSVLAAADDEGRFARHFSGEHFEEARPRYVVLREGGMTDFVVIPGQGGDVRVMDIPFGEDFIAVLSRKNMVSEKFADSSVRLSGQPGGLLPDAPLERQCLSRALRTHMVLLYDSI